MYPLLDRILLWVFCMHAGRAAADRLRHAADWLYPTDDPKIARYRRSRLLFRSLLHARPTALWLEFLWSEQALLALLRQHPCIAEKIHRPYSCKRLGAGSRMERLRSHYQLALRQPGMRLLLEAGRADHVLAEFEGMSGRGYRLVLGSGNSLPKEGELILRLDCEGFTLLKAAFTCDRCNGNPALVIGCWQGNKCPTSKGRMREATRDLSGLRPRNLLFMAVQAIAQAHGMTSIIGVGDRQHIYRHWRNRRRIIQSYDAVWSDLGGAEGMDGMFILPGRHVQRPLSAYPSSKRGAMARRQAFESQVLAQLSASFAAARQAGPEQGLPAMADALAAPAGAASQREPATTQ